MKTNRNTSHRTLKAEQLERRELLAADWGGATAVPPDSCQIDDVAVVQGPMQALPADAAPQPQQRSREEASSGGGALQRPRDRISEEVTLETDVTLTVSAIDTAARQGGGGQTVPTSTELSAKEVENLLFVREEEKLARDVYLALAEKWDAPIFSNIAQSEQQHMDSVGQLIEKYGLTDPIVDDTPGNFTDPTLQRLYDDLVGSDEANLDYLVTDLKIDGGDMSELAAYKVGAFIEEFDILDIQHSIEQTTHGDIENVYGNLLRGSRNHLRSFVSQIDATGDIYEPVVMSSDLYQDIISGDQETANGRGSGRQQAQAGLQGLQTAEPTIVAIDQLYAEYGRRSGRKRS